VRGQAVRQCVHDVYFTSPPGRNTSEVTCSHGPWLSRGLRATMIFAGLVLLDVGWLALQIPR